MKDHTSLQAWQQARIVSLGVLEAARLHWKPWAAAIVAQLQRASLSVQLNIAEGATFNRSPTYTRHLGIAYGSAVETGELIDLAIEAGLFPREVGAHLREHCQHSQRLLLGLLKRHRPMG
jgi:four helix bundle protein